MAVDFLDVCKFTPVAGGLGDFVYSAALTGYQSPTNAGAVNGETYRYRAESADLSQWEIGTGVYNSGTDTFARTTILFSSTGSKVNFTTVPTVGIVFVADDILRGALGRERLTANRTYYVRSDGSDTSTGLVDSSVGAFLTIQRAVDVIAMLDLSGFSATVQVKDATFTGLVNLKNVTGFAAAGDLVIQGNATTPANVLISTAGNAFTSDGLNVTWDIKNLKIQTSSGSGIVARNGSNVRYGNINFGSCATAHVQCLLGAAITQLSSYAISGGAGYHWMTYDGGMILGLPSSTITITGTPAFSQSFILAGTLGLFDGFSITFSGSATGVRHNIYGNAAVFIAGAGINYFPGNSAGSTTSGGQLI